MEHGIERPTKKNNKGLGSPLIRDITSTMENQMEKKK